MLVFGFLTIYNKHVINEAMTTQEFKSARLQKGWTQTEAARRLGMTQAYLNYLEHGKRRLTPGVVRKAAVTYGLSPEVFPVPEVLVPATTGDARLTDLLAALGYPGFSYLHKHGGKKNPMEVLLTALAQPSLDARVAEALPWVALQYAQPDLWLVDNARRLNLQNKLGFVVTLAQRAAENTSNSSRAAELGQLALVLDDSRLAKEDSFYRPPRSERERQWLKENRTTDASHWNLLTDMRPEHLKYAQ
jgi:transcriptional regulator with XRE-family HTH domain